MKMKHSINAFENWKSKFKTCQHSSMVIAPRIKSRRRREFQRRW
ncbi:hypothetical protein IC582_019206 [Cucumis melo]